MAVSVTIPLQITVSLGQPTISQGTKVVPQRFEDKRRNCAQCGCSFIQEHWNSYPQCDKCKRKEEEQFRLQYERELASPRRVEPALPSFNEVNNSNWPEEGF